MKRILKNLFPGWYAKRLRAIAEARLYEKWLDGSRGVGEDEDWLPVGGAESKSPAADMQTLTQLRNRSRELAGSNPHAAAALRVFVNFVVGDGVGVFPATPDPMFNDRAAAIWGSRRKEEGFDARFNEMVRRTFRDGEAFLRRFISGGKVRLRFIDPEYVASPPEFAADAPRGIRFSPNDAETPLEYFVAAPAPDGTGTVFERVDASDVLHVKLGVDANVPRGVPLLTPVIRRLKEYDNWLESMLTLHRVRSAVALVKKYTSASPSEILAAADRSATSATTRSDGSVTRRRKLEPGSIIHASAGMDYQMLSPNIHAADADVLGRAILLSIAAGLGLSETMLTADSNNVNYASSSVAETPALMEFREQQRVFRGEVERIYRWVIEAALANGELAGPLPPDPYAVIIHPSPMPTRDLFRNVQAWSTLLDRGVVGADYIRGKLGLDYSGADSGLPRG